MRTFWLSTHLDYACRHSGACCTARWPIPVERDRAAAIQTAIGAGELVAPAGWLRSAPGSPSGIAGLLGQQSSGACVFHRRPEPPLTGGCAVHRVRPSSCEHFPYVTVTDPRGTYVTLSHFCPSAAELLFRDAPVSVVEGPALFADGRTPEGLDAREALPPVDRASPAATPRLMDWDEVTRWERAFIERLATDRRVPAAPSLDAFAEAQAATGGDWAWADAPVETLSEWRRSVAPRWADWAAVIGRYLAAKVHASWAMCLGDGPAAVERAVDLARTVLQVEAVRVCAAQQAPLDRLSLHAAIRQADLLLVHHAVPERLYEDRRETTEAAQP